MNIVLGFLSIVITFSLVLIFEKLFNKEGLFVWISIAVIIANIIVCKNIDILSFTTTLGNVLFASVFLATDIMNEKYGMKESRKAILMGVCAEIVFLISTQMALKFIPSTADMVHTSMETLFSINLRVSIDGVEFDTLPNSGNYYLADYDCNNKRSIIYFGKKYY